METIHMLILIAYSLIITGIAVYYIGEAKSYKSSCKQVIENNKGWIADNENLKQELEDSHVAHKKLIYDYEGALRDKFNNHKFYSGLIDNILEEEKGMRLEKAKKAKVTMESIKIEFSEPKKYRVDVSTTIESVRDGKYYNFPVQNPAYWLGNQEYINSLFSDK